MDKSRMIFERRRSTLKKKAGELAAKCNAEVCTICFGPDGDLQVWPENPTEAQSVIDKYTEANKIGSKCKRKEKLDLSDLMENEIKKLRKKVLEDETLWNDSGNGIEGFPLWNEALDSLSEKSLTDFSGFLEAKIQIFELLKGKQVVPSMAQNQFEHKNVPFGTPLPEDVPFDHNQFC